MKIKTFVSFVDEQGVPRWPGDEVEVSDKFATALREACEKLNSQLPEVVEEAAPKAKRGGKFSVGEDEEEL